MVFVDSKMFILKSFVQEADVCALKSLTVSGSCRTVTQSAAWRSESDAIRNGSVEVVACERRRGCLLIGSMQEEEEKVEQ